MRYDVERDVAKKWRETCPILEDARAFDEILERAEAELG